MKRSGRSWTKVFKHRSVSDSGKTYTLEDFQGEGIEFPAKYLGRPQVPKPNGQQHVLDAIAEAKSYSKRNDPMHRKPLKVVAKVSVKGFSTCDEKSGSIVSHNPIHRITAWYPDKSDDELFGIIVKGEGGHTGMAESFVCIVLKSHKAHEILSALKDMMNIVFKQLQPPPAQQSGKQPSLSAPASRNESVRTSPALRPKSTHPPQRDPVAKPPQKPAPKKWACLECTFQNDESAAECEMCGSMRSSEKSRQPHPTLGETSTYEVNGDIYAVPSRGNSSSAIPIPEAAPRSDSFSDYATPRSIKVSDTLKDDAFFEADFGKKSAQKSPSDAPFKADFGSAFEADFEKADEEDRRSVGSGSERVGLSAETHSFDVFDAFGAAGAAAFADHDYANLPATASNQLPPAGGSADGFAIETPTLVVTAPPSSSGDYVNLPDVGGGGGHDYVNLSERTHATTNGTIVTITEDEIDESLFAATNPFRLDNPFSKPAVQDAEEQEDSELDDEDILDLTASFDMQQRQQQVPKAKAAAAAAAAAQPQAKHEPQTKRKPNPFAR